MTSEPVRRTARRSLPRPAGRPGRPARPRAGRRPAAGRRLAALLAALVLILAACGDPGEDAAPAAGAPFDDATTETRTTRTRTAATPDAAGSDAAPAGDGPEAGATTADDSDARIVRTIEPEVGALTATRSASATINAARDANVASGASARVVEILARPGDVVSDGDPVIRLDDTQARLQLRNAELAVRQAEVDLASAGRSSEEGAGQAQASLRAAESHAAALRDQVEDLRALVEAGGAARSDLRSLEVQLEQAESQVLQARDAVARAGRSGNEDLALLELRLEQARVQAAQARDQLEQTTLTAPFDGRIVELHLETGEFAGAGSPAFRIQSAEEREAVVDLPAEDAVRLQEQGTVTIRYAGRELTGEIVASARPAQQPRTVRLTARLEGEGAASVPSGAVADVRYTVTVAEGTLVPASAVSAEAGGTYVHVVRDGVATRVPVDVLGEAAATAAVEGVGPDDAVISPRPLDVREGTAVRIAGG